jgi:hypothetical protein
MEAKREGGQGLTPPPGEKRPPAPPAPPMKPRDMMSPLNLVQCLASYGNYMMHHDCLPVMDCPNCFHSLTPDGGHCYMFRNKPEGDRCGQFKSK